MWADAATGLQDIETWLNAHPALLSLVQNAGNVVGGAMWLKNLTPVGLVSYLVVNYGYDRILHLLEGGREVEKQQLTTYFLEHDADITPEQAGYLANFATQVLQTAGKVVVHQVAAAKFDAVSKVGGWSIQGNKAFKHNFKYHSRIRARALQDPTAHNFAYSFDDVILKVKPIKQANGSLLFRKQGTLNGKNGYFEIGLNPETNTIFRRTFVQGRKVTK